MYVICVNHKCLLICSNFDQVYRRMNMKCPEMRSAASATLRPINKQKKQMCSIVDEFPQANGELIVLFHVQPVKGRKLVKLHPQFHVRERDPRGVTADFPYHCIHNRGTAHGTARGSRHGVGIHHMYLAHGE